MKQLFLALSLLFFSSISLAQTINDLVNEGVRYHDEGQYENAIQSYSKALEIDPNSTWANYEIAYTYSAMGNCEKAMKHSDVVIKQKKDNLIAAYTIKGNCLDDTGHSSEAVKLYKKAIKKHGDDYMLYYNLSLTYFKMKEFDKSEESAANAVRNNAGHPTSHLMISAINEMKGNKIQAILAGHLFLLLEPGSERAENIYNLVYNTTVPEVTKSEDGKSNVINISLLPNGDSDFMAAELILALKQANLTTETDDADENGEEVVEMTPLEHFIDNTTSILNVLGEMNEDGKKKGILWEVHIPYLYAMSQSEHMETYCMFILQGFNEDAQDWLDENEEKVIAFKQFLAGN